MPTIVDITAAIYSRTESEKKMHITFCAGDKNEFDSSRHVHARMYFSGNDIVQFDCVKICHVYVYLRVLMQCAVKQLHFSLRKIFERTKKRMALQSKLHWKILLHNLLWIPPTSMISFRI